MLPRWLRPGGGQAPGRHPQHGPRDPSAPPPPGKTGTPGGPDAPLPSSGSAARTDASSPGSGRWAPIVVDEPIFEFEPKPPRPSDTYRPDTTFDGWSTARFTVRLASVRGYSHRYSGAPRQDDASVACDPASGAVIFTVADGVSSAEQSHLGAAAACHGALNNAARQLAAGHQPHRLGAGRRRGRH